MAKSKNPRQPQDEGQSTVAGAVLLVGGTRVQRELLNAQLAGKVDRLLHADGSRTAYEALASGPVCGVIIALEDADESLALTTDISRRYPGTAVVIRADKPTLDDAVCAMRAGASDLIAAGVSGSELVTRLAEAVRRAQPAKSRQERLDKLRKLCRTLNESREDVTRQVGGLCSDLANAYSDLSDKLTLVTVASEFNSLIRQELEIESLLRTVLEYLLTKTGPTNAAIFLPSTSGDFTLGAYVNYDGPKDSAEVILDHLADTLAPRFEHERGVVHLSGRNQIAARAGRASEWLGDANLIVFSCHNDDECLAVVALFRDKKNAFTDAIVQTLEALSGLFGKQLARVVHVHHRHLPQSKWGKTAEGNNTREEDDDLPDIDLAA